MVHFTKSGEYGEWLELGQIWKREICSLLYRDFSMNVTKILCRFYTYDKTTSIKGTSLENLRGSSIQLTEFINETSTKIVQPYL